MKIQKRHVVLAALVVSLGVATFINWQFSDNAPHLVKDVSKELGAATYVNANLNSTDDQVASVSKTTSKEEAFFSKAVVDRQQARDEAVEIAQQTVSAADSSDEAKTKAVEQLNKIEDNIVKENSIESLLKAKGFNQCICYISENTCSVSLPKNNVKDNAPLIIKDVVLSQINIDFNDITIIEV